MQSFLFFFTTIFKGQLDITCWRIIKVFKKVHPTSTSKGHVDQIQLVYEFERCWKMNFITFGVAGSFQYIIVYISYLTDRHEGFSYLTLEKKSVIS